MINLKIRLNTINDVKEFVNITNRYDFDIDLVCGRYAIDGKSIMGIFSLDLSKVIEVQAHVYTADNFIDELRKFIAEEDESAE